MVLIYYIDIRNLIKDRNFEERFANLKVQIDELKQWFASKGLVQAEHQQQGILQAGSKQEPTPREQLDTMLSYMDGTISIEQIPFHNTPNIKQAGVKKPVSDFEQMQTLLKFSGML